MRRTLAVLRLAAPGLLIAVGAAAQTGGPDPAAAFVGRWAEERGLELVRVLSVRVEGGRLVANLSSSSDIRDDGEVFQGPLPTGPRAVLDAAPPDPHEIGGGAQTAVPGRLVLERRGEALVIVEGRSAAGSVRGTRLTRRDELWVRMRYTFIDMDHEADGEGYPPRSYFALARAVEEVRRGVRDAGRADLLESQREAECAFEDVLARVFGDATEGPPLRVVARLQARAGSLCEVERVDPVGCDRVRVVDPDGATTVRAEPRARSSARGTIAAGEERAVTAVHGRWLRVDGSPAGWVFADNVECAR